MLKDKSENAARLMATVFFLLLTEGFILYNEVVVRRLAPPLLGGFFGTTSVASLFFLGVPSVKLLFASAFSGKYFYAKAIIAFFAWISLVTLFYWATGYEKYQDEAVQQSFAVLPLWYSMFSIGLFLRPNKILENFTIGFLIAVVMFILIYCFESGSLMYYAKQGSQGLDEVLSSYQGYARSLSILFIYVFSLSYNQPIKLLLGSLIGSISLFFAGARSEFIGYIIVNLAVIAIDLIKVNSKKTSVNLKRLVPFSLLVLFLIVISFYALSSNLDSRILQLFNVVDDSSYIARQDLEALGMMDISSNPLLGVFGGHVAATGSIGGYMHTILSAWAGFGLPAFALILYLQLAATLGSLWLVKRSYSQLCVLTFTLNLFSTFLLFTAKPIFWVVPPLGWGLFLQVSLSETCGGYKRPRLLHGP